MFALPYELRLLFYVNVLSIWGEGTKIIWKGNKSIEGGTFILIIEILADRELGNPHNPPISHHV